MTTKKLKFLVDGVVNGEVVFKAGETYDIPVETGSFTRWLKRGAIEVHEEMKASVEEVVVSEDIPAEAIVEAKEIPALEEEVKIRPKKQRKH